jgi:hypothetical protein
VYKGTTRSIGQAAEQRVALSVSVLLALLVGTSVYLLDRNWATVQFLVPFAGLQGEQVNLFGSMGNVLPAFCHAYAFSLLLILALGRTRRACLVGPLVWFAVAAGLEILQAEPIAGLLLSPTVPQPDSPVLGSLINYSVNGRFDPGDLLAAGLGCVTALLAASVVESGS